MQHALIVLCCEPGVQAPRTWPPADLYPVRHRYLGPWRFTAFGTSWARYPWASSFKACHYWSKLCTFVACPYGFRDRNTMILHSKLRSRCKGTDFIDKPHTDLRVSRCTREISTLDQRPSSRTSRGRHMPPWREAWGFIRGLEHINSRKALRQCSVVADDVMRI